MKEHIVENINEEELGFKIQNVKKYNELVNKLNPLLLEYNNVVANIISFGLYGKVLIQHIPIPSKIKIVTTPQDHLESLQDD